MASQEIAIQLCDSEYFLTNFDLPVSLHIERPLKEHPQTVRFSSRDLAECAAAQLTIAGYSQVDVISHWYPNQETHKVIYR